MGMIRSQTNLTGHTHNAVQLGDPIAPVRADGSPSEPGDSMLELFWAWDDSAFPTGVGEVVDGVLVVTPDEVEL
jgi:hypothetical protein